MCAYLYAAEGVGGRACAVHGHNAPSAITAGRSRCL